MPIRCTVLLLMYAYSFGGVVCQPNEYLIEGRCCAMCDIGYRVVEDCTDKANVSCEECSNGYFNNEPSGRRRCKDCTDCNKGLGLKAVKKCTAVADTVCGPLDGYCCTKPYKEGCGDAKEHTRCQPGQYIKQPGNVSADTICGNCSENSYSNGSSTSCKSHSNCTSRGLLLLKPGDHSMDAVCEESTGTGIAVKVTLLILAVIGVIVVVVVDLYKTGKLCSSQNTIMIILLII